MWSILTWSCNCCFLWTIHHWSLKKWLILVVIFRNPFDFCHLKVLPNSNSSLECSSAWPQDQGLGKAHGVHTPGLIASVSTSLQCLSSTISGCDFDAADFQLWQLDKSHFLQCIICVFDRWKHLQDCASQVLYIWKVDALGIVKPKRNDICTT